MQQGLGYAQRDVCSEGVWQGRQHLIAMITYKNLRVLI